MSKDNGGPAFPGAQPEYIDHPAHGHIRRADIGMEAEPGMSLRDYFAGHAVVGVITSYHSGGILKFTGQTAMEAIAAAAYQISDAMLAERTKDGAA